MARYPRTHRSLIRRSAVLLTLFMAAGGLVALEHTATGASTGTPSNSYGHRGTTTTTSRHDGNDHDRHHHPSTTTSSTTSTSTTSTTTTTTMPKDPNRNCRDHHGHHHKFRCRPPSGGQKPHHPKPHKPGKKNEHH